MRSYAEKSRKSHIVRFWLVTMLCAGMIGAACWFAYRQTAHELSVQLETTVGSINPQPATNPPYTKPVQMPATTALQTERATEPRRETKPREIETSARATETTAQTETQTETVPVKRCKPVEGEILQPFSDGALVKSPTTGVWQTHNGVDISASLGEDVHAMDAGVISQIEDNALWGIVVTIDHKNGSISRYCNLSEQLAVSEGDTVESGTVIGTVGQTADAESAGETHLHVEVLINGKYVDPMELLSY